MKLGYDIKGLHIEFDSLKLLLPKKYVTSVGIFGKTQFEALDYRMHVSIILGILDLIAMKAYVH